jgi:hypothetical protein
MRADGGRDDLLDSRRDLASGQIVWPRRHLVHVSRNDATTGFVMAYEDGSLRTHRPAEHRDGKAQGLLNGRATGEKVREGHRRQLPRPVVPAAPEVERLGGRWHVAGDNGQAVPAIDSFSHIKNGHF